MTINHGQFHKSNELVAALHEDSGGVFPGFRAGHALGRIYVGTFTPRAAARSLSRAVHFSTPVPVTVRFCGTGVYVMSKAALVAWSRVGARPDPRGITINNVQPGPVETGLNPATGPFAESLKAEMALKRYAQGDEIAARVAYLAGPEAGFVTDASLTIDGGFAA